MIDDQFDDERISRREVSLDERIELEKQLLQMYHRRAEAAGKRVIIVTDMTRYEELRDSGYLFDDDEFYLFMDEEKNVLDMVPVAQRLLDTEEGNFYAKLILQGEDHQP